MGCSQDNRKILNIAEPSNNIEYGRVNKNVEYSRVNKNIEYSRAK